MEFIKITTSINGARDIDENFRRVNLGAKGFEHQQLVPASVWGPFEHGLGHIPSSVSLWINGRMGIGTTEADETYLTVTLGSNQTGILRAH